MRLDHEFREEVRFAARSPTRCAEVAPRVIEQRQEYAGSGEG